MRVFISMLIVLFFSSATALADKITLRADEWCPYNCQPKSTTPGFMVEVANIVFKNAGHEIEYKVMPWSRAIKDARDGRYTGIIGAYKDDAPDFIFPENELGYSQNTFFVKAGDTWKFEGISKLDVPIGVIRDYSYGDELDEYIKKNKDDLKKIQLVPGEDALEKNIKKVMINRIRSFIEDPMVLNYHLKQTNRVGEIVPAGTLSGEKVYIAFSPKLEKSRGYAEILSKGIADLRKSGKLKEILSHYGLDDWQ